MLDSLQSPREPQYLYLVLDAREGTLRIEQTTEEASIQERWLYRWELPSELDLMFFRDTINQGKLDEPLLNLLRTGVDPETWEPYPGSEFLYEAVEEAIENLMDALDEAAGLEPEDGEAELAMGQVLRKLPIEDSIRGSAR